MSRCFIVALLAASTSFLDVCILSLYCTRLASMSGQQGTTVVGSCKRSIYARTIHLRFLLCTSTVCNFLCHRRQKTRPMLMGLIHVSRRQVSSLMGYDSF